MNVPSVFNVTIILSILIISLIARVAVEVTGTGKTGSQCGSNIRNLELTIVQDVSGTIMDRYDKKGKLITALKTAFESLHQDYPSPKYAYTTFSDYAQYTKSTTSSCYTMRKELTVNSEEIINAIQQAKAEGKQAEGDDHSESSLTAVLYTAADKRLQWSTSNPQKILKVIAVVTDETSKTADNDTTHTGPPPKGEGSDTCDNGMPKWKFVGSVLKREKIFLLGLIASEKMDTWKEYGKLMGLTENQFAIHQFQPDDSADIMGQTIIDSVNSIPCPLPPIGALKCGVARKLEFTLVQDVTFTYFQGDYFTKLENTLKIVFKTLKREYPGTKYGYTTFSDYGAICYTWRNELSQDSDSVITAIQQVKGEGAQSGGPDAPEASLTAVFYTAVEKRLKWTTKVNPKKPVLKVIAVATDEASKTSDSDTSHTGPAPKGDGSDTCVNGMPTYRLIGDVLKRENIFLVGLIAPQKMSEWNAYGQRMGLSRDQYAIHKLSHEDSEDVMAKTILESIDNIPCPPQRNCTFPRHAPSVKASDCKIKLKAPYMQLTPNSKFIIKNDFGWADETKKEQATIADQEAACVAEGFQLPGAAHLPDWLSIQKIGREYIKWGMKKGYHNTLYQAFADYNLHIVNFIFGMGDRDENKQWVHTSGEKDIFVVWDYKFGNPSDASETSITLCLYLEEGKWFLTANDLPKTQVNDKFFPIFFCQFPYDTDCYKSSIEEQNYKKKYEKDEYKLRKLDLPTKIPLNQSSNIEWAISNVPKTREEAIKLCECNGKQLWDGSTKIFEHHEEAIIEIGQLVMDHFRKLDIVPQAPFHTKDKHQMSYFVTPKELKTQNTGHSKLGAPTPLFAICFSHCE